MDLFGLLSNVALDIDASQNLFSPDWTEGNLYAINGIVDKLGTFACWVISIVGFGIVIFSILKNAMSGLYVVNPNFWDRVDEVKNQAVTGVTDTITSATGSIGGKGSVAAQKIGGVLIFILRLIPNIKALTDFDDEEGGATIDKKQYFMRSIPLLVAQIFIGMLIFFGYPAKIANWIGTGATYAISAVLENVDPVQTAQKISDRFVKYNLSTDGSQDPCENNVNKATTEMIAAMHSKYNDIDTASIQNIAYAMESDLLSKFSTEDRIRDVLGASEGYKYTINTQIATAQPSVSAGYKMLENGVYCAQATNGTMSYKYWTNVSQMVGTASTKVGPDDYFVWTIQATPEAVSNVSSANAVLCGGVTIPTNPTKNGNNNTVSFTVNGIKFGSEDRLLNGTPGKTCTLEAIDFNGNTIKTYNCSLITTSVSNLEGATPILQLNFVDAKWIVDNKNSWMYLKVNLTGSWSISVPASKGNVKSKMNVSELRLTNGSNGGTIFISTWTNVDAKTCIGEKLSTFNTNSMTKSEGSFGDN